MWVSFFFSFFLCLSASAQFFSLSVTDYGRFGAGQDLDDPTLRAEVDSIVASVQAEVNSSLPDLDQSKFIKGMANSNAIASKGAIETPISKMKYFSVGLGGGMGVDLGNNSLSALFNGTAKPETFGAFGLYSGLILGVPVSYVGLGELLPNAKLTLAFLSLNQNFSSIEFKMSSFAARLSMPLIEGHVGWARWTGVRVATGLEYASARLVASQSLTADLSDEASSINVDGFGDVDLNTSFTQSVSFGADVTTYSIPFEVSSGAELLHFASAFLGLGLDLNFGTAKSIVNGGGPVSFDASAGGTSLTTITATGSINAGDKGGPRFENLRLFYGMQFDAYLFNFYFQVNQMLLDSVYGVAGGLRTEW